MEEVCVKVVDAEVLERAFEGLHDLPPDRRARVVRQPVVLGVAKRELRLEEHLIAR